MAYRFRRYVPVRERKDIAERETARMRGKGEPVQSVHIVGRLIARTFWGKAWCDHLESFSDFENRLPRGRTYVRNGSVCHLEVLRGEVRAKVQGNELYAVTVEIDPLGKAAWKKIKLRCTGKISSLLDLLQGRLSNGVMEIVTDRQKGMFPQPGEIRMSCTCPDWAEMCKHVAAALYGVGARLDERPELLFLLRGVDHEELVDTHAVDAVQEAVQGGSGQRIPEKDIAEIFGIDTEPVPKAKKRSRKSRSKPPHKSSGDGATLLS